MTARPLLVAVLLATMVAGCIGSREAERSPDDRFGHRIASGEDAAGRLTIELAEPDDVQHFYYPVFVDSLHVRPAEFEPHLRPEIQRVAVEVLVKGVFPDDCSDLATIEQRRYGHIIEVDLMMRKPQDSVCMRLRRPFRFYFLLDGSYRAGHYTLKLNGSNYSFEVREG